MRKFLHWLTGLIAIVWRVPRRPLIKPGERPLVAFVSSVMRPEVQWARDETARTLDGFPFADRWLFEYTSGSSEPVDDGYLRKVREADVVIWLVGKETTDPVHKEISEALASERRLWVFKLPADRRDKATEDLLHRVQPIPKYVNVSGSRDLRRKLRLIFGDEIVRAMRGKPGLGRLDLLDELVRESRARRMRLWRAAGVPQPVALELATDPSIGAPSAEMQPRAEKPMLVLVGEIGAGKSLIAEHLFQRAVTRAREHADAPVPVYLEAQHAVGRLQETIEKDADGLGNPRIQGAAVVIDGADKVGSDAAADLVNEAHVLVGTWPNTTVVITSRPIPTLTQAEEAVEVPQLSETEAQALIGRFAGQHITLAISGWPESVRSAVCRPLFAVLLGTYLRERGAGTPHSTAELISSLVERSLRQTKANRISADRALQRLAVLSIDSGKSLVHNAEIVSRAELVPLLDSRLVIERSGMLGFSLQILTDWFASQSLATGIPSPDELTSDRRRLEQWRYPLIIFTGTSSYDEVSRVFVPLVEKDPAVAAEIVKEGVISWSLARDTLPSLALLDYGQRVRTAMQAWARGIGPLAKLIAPVREDGTLRPLGVRSFNGVDFVRVWYHGREDLPEVVDLPPDVPGPNLPFELRRDWPGFWDSSVGHQPAWPWRHMLDELVHQLSGLLQRRTLPVNEGPLTREILWLEALAVTSRGSLHRDPISLTEIEKYLSRFSENTGISGVGGRRVYIDRVRSKVEELCKRGETEVSYPWPGPDRFKGNLPWERYTPEQTLTRVKAVFEGALEAYQQLVDMWFPKFASRLWTATMLPARLVALLGNTADGGPTIRWYLEALPQGSQNIVDVCFATEGVREDNYALSRSLKKDLPFLRPGAVKWLRPIIHSELAYDLFELDPVTKLVYRWLWDDLEQVSWVEGILRRYW